MIPDPDRRGRPLDAHPVETRSGPSADPATATWVVVADLLAKVGLLAFLALAVIDPDWGNLAGKSPVARAITYPLWSLAIPAAWLLLGRHRPFPWMPDLLVTLTCFTDILGNRLNMYDRIWWFDDWMHLMNVAFLSAAVLLLTDASESRFICRLERSLAFAMTAGLTWELFEFAAFVTRSGERTTAYADTLGDLTLGWLGAVLAAVAITMLHRHPRRDQRATLAHQARCGRWPREGLHRGSTTHCQLDPLEAGVQRRACGSPARGVTPVRERAPHPPPSAVR